jgi:cullin-4
MKKSGGLVINLKKKKKPQILPGGRPPSPVTVVNEQSSTTNSNAPSSSKSKHKLVIKPFVKPPSLPPDFYETCLTTLRRAAVAVLRRQPLTTQDNDDDNGAHRLMSREELYRSVQDLIVHGYGVELYGEVIRIVDEAAREIVRRLEGSERGVLLNKNDNGSSSVGYEAQIVMELLGLKEKEDNQYGLLQEQRLELLRQWHSVCRVSYAEEYLTFVRSIFLVLDRAFVFMSEEELENIHSRGSAVEETTLKGKVLDRNTSFGGSNSRVWGLWEVGIACLRRHVTVTPETNRNEVFPVLTAMVLVTTHAVLSEYDDNNMPGNHASNQGITSSTALGDTRPLIRNCVQTCIDLGAMSPLLEELIVAASSRFRNESQSWGRNLNESKKTAPQFLSHVEHRLKQSSALTTYYLPSNAGASALLRQLSNRSEPLIGSSKTVDKCDGVTWKSVNSNTRRILPAIIEAELLSPHLKPTGILHPKHLYPILDDCVCDGNSSYSWKSAEKTFENAKRLYGLCWRMTATSAASSTSTVLENLRVAFGEYGRLRGTEIIKQGAADGTSNTGSKETEKSIIPDLLAFKAHLQSLLTVAFRSDESFVASVRSILEDVCNGSTLPGGGDGGRHIAELLAKHVDARFKDAKAQATPAVMSTLSASVDTTVGNIDHNESFQNQIMTIFRHVHSKDVFEAFYKRDLAKRLLTGRSVSSDVERSFLSKLKAECGAGYTSKMEGMFKDMELSRDIMTSYSAYSTGSSNSNVVDPSIKTDMDVQVLTTGYWPVYPQYPNIILPPELLAHQANFETYYKNKYQGRRIAWQYSLGNCIVKASFPKQPAGKELIINLCQTLVLLCFQYEDGPDGKGLRIDDIIKKTGIDDRAEVERVLQSLSLGRDGTRVLIKVDQDSPSKASDLPSPTSVSDNSSPGKKKQKVKRNVGPHDRFLFNASFTSNQRRIRITNITMKETTQERSETHEAVSKDRLYLIDAAVVRIMKARKTIDHRDLMGEVMTQLKFPSSSADIKKRIESLIEREYMERVEGDRSRYNYLA